MNQVAGHNFLHSEPDRSDVQLQMRNVFYFFVLIILSKLWITRSKAEAWQMFESPGAWWTSVIKVCVLWKENPFKQDDDDNRLEKVIQK